MNFEGGAVADAGVGLRSTKFDGIIFDFDGVLIDSEYAGNLHTAHYLTKLGFPTTPEYTMSNFMGLAGEAFTSAIESYIGRTLPEDFHTARAEEDVRVLAQGLDAVEGAVAFIEALPDDFPKAIASSSSSAWIVRHLEHLGLRDRFGDKIFSGREHVTRGKPAPDLYLHAAAALGIDIKRAAIVEDSPVGATGAVASGAYVIGLTAGRHCGPGHSDRLRAIGVDAIASNFVEVAAAIA